MGIFNLLIVSLVVDGLIDNQRGWGWGSVHEVNRKKSDHVQRDAIL